MYYRMKKDFANGLGKLKSFAKSAKGIELAYENEKVRIEFLKDDLFRIKISQAGKFDEKPSCSVSRLPSSKITLQIKQDKKQIVLASGTLKVIVNKNPFNVRAVRNDGSVILEGIDWNIFKEDPYLSMNSGWFFRMKKNKDDLFLGLGEKTGGLDKSGRKYQMWNTDILGPESGSDVVPDVKKGDPARDPSSQAYDPYYMSIPFFYRISRKDKFAASGLFFDNPYRGYFDLDGKDDFTVEFNAGQLTLYVFNGPSISSILEDYSALTGRMELPPMWALGHHQCRWKAYTEKDIRELAANYRKLGIPCDTLWLDIDYMDGFRVFTWNRERFPDMKKLTDEMLEKGFRMITIVDPGVKYDPSYSACREGIKGDHFCRCANGNLFMGRVWPGQTVFPDFTQEKTRRWWGKLNGEHAKKNGLAGIWNDMNEPATKDSDLSDMRFDFHGENYPHERFHNEYGTLMAMSTKEGLEKAFPGKRTFILSRAGSPGIQRYAANWLGDNFSRWEHMWQSIPMSTGLSISGQPFVGADAGGFAQACNPELLARWIMYAALTPFCRNHNADGQGQEPWEMEGKATDVYRKAVKLRYKLLPYIYTAFAESSRNGTPVMAPMPYYFQSDAKAYKADDQYMFGPDLLVAPIYKKDQKSRKVYLPKGDWYDFWTGKSVRGGKTIDVKAPLNIIPLFVRAGAVIPMLSDEIDSTVELKHGEIELHVFVPACNGNWKSLLMEDDGETTDYRKGKYFKTEFILTRNGKKAVLVSRTSGKGFSSFKRKKFKVILHSAGGHVDFEDRITMEY